LFLHSFAVVLVFPVLGLRLMSLYVTLVTVVYVIIVFSFWFLLFLMINDLSCFIGVLVYVGCSGAWNSWI